MFDLRKRIHRLERSNARRERLANWRRDYPRRRAQKLIANVALGLMLFFLILWPLSYWRPTFRTPEMIYRATWGALAMFVCDENQEYPTDYSFSIAGYRDMETMWWPIDMWNRDYRRVFIPLWLPASIIGALWFLLYRPDRHLLAKRRLRFIGESLGNATDNALNSEPTSAKQAKLMA